jgi:hypothetical protein
LFARARKKSRFLEFVCEQSFLGKADQINEYLIGVEVYERGPDFDPNLDPIVRVQAHEIRRTLKRYYEEEGRDSAWRIDLPPGHYVPAFTRADAHKPDWAPANGQGRISQPVRSAAPRQNALIVGLASICLVLAGLLFWEQSQPRNIIPARAVSSTLPEALEWFWKPFLPPADPPLIAIPNHPLLRAAHDGDSSGTLARSHLIPKDKLPEFHDTIHFRELKGFYFVPSTTDFTSVGETLGLLNFFELFQRTGQRLRLKPSRLVDYGQIKESNCILLGGNQSWSGRIFLYPEGFWFQRGVIRNKNPRPGEQAVYKPNFDPVTNNLTKDYALVLMLPNEKRENRILLIYGVYTQGSQAAIEYVTNPERLQELRRALVEISADKKRPPNFFQALLTTTVENFVPGQASLVAARVIPE